ALACGAGRGWVFVCRATRCAASCRLGSHVVGFSLVGVVGRSDAQFRLWGAVLRRASLLLHVRKLVREQLPARSGVRLILAFTQVDMIAMRKGLGIQLAV